MMGPTVRIELANVVTVQCPQHADPRQHRRAAALGDQDQSLHRCLPMLALSLGRRQRQDVDTSIAQASKFAAIAGRDWIVEVAGPTCLLAAGPLQIAHRISKERSRQQLAAGG